MKSGYWIPTQIEDKEIKYSFEPHSPQKLKGLPWIYCKYCGLIYLNNKVTRWCIKMGCNANYHPNYKNVLSSKIRRALKWDRKAK